MLFNRIFNNLFNIKYRVIAVLLLINIALYFSIQSQKSYWLGEIEIPTHTWLFYATQINNRLDHNITYVDVTKPELEPVSLNTRYPFHQVDKNKYLLINPDMPVKINQQTVYALDETCSLIFRGPNLIKMNNVVLSCRVN